MNNIKDNVNRLNYFIDEVLKRYLVDINDLNTGSSDIYQEIIFHLVNGDLNDIIDSDYLIGIDPVKKNEILLLANKYSRLCFFDNSYVNWKKSIKGMSLNDYEFICFRILENYYYLLRLISIDNNNKIIKLLDFCSKTDLFNNCSIIDCLRNIFYSDDCLEKVLIDITDDYSLYKSFSNYQKAVLLRYPEGLLYKNKNDNINYVNPIELIGKIVENDSLFNLDLVTDTYISNSINKLKDFGYYFENRIIEIYENYKNNNA